MKTNLTTKQVKKIQNGKLAIYKDIDTADAREYLLLFLNCKFPNDKSTEKGKTICIKENKIFIGFGDGRWGFDRLEDNSLPTVPLSKIMYTYNPEQFKPISMPCTEEQWNNDLKPVVEAFGVSVSQRINEMFNSSSHNYFLTNNCDDKKFITYLHPQVYKKSVHGKKPNTYSPTEFLEACGIVRVNKEEKVCFADAIKVFSGNTRSKSFSSELFKEYMVYPITTDQIKTARTNPETLEQLFPKVFEKPVVEVGKWWHIKSKGSNFEYKFYITKNENGQLYGYGFDDESVWHNENPLIREHVIESATLCNLSDLKPLFEAEFNKRYKEGDLLRTAKGIIEFNYINKFSFGQLISTGYITDSHGRYLFHNGNFAKVIKSAELIKAEEELEQAKMRVESLKGKC